MYILELYQEESSTEIAVFDSLEDGRAFVSAIPGYEREEEDGFIYEYLSPEKLPDYMEAEFKNNIIPISRFMFPEEGRIDIVWKELPYLSSEGHGMVSGSTRVDAYIIANEDVREYIDKRESNYRLLKEHLEEQGFDVARGFHGSEDGEAILCKKSGSEEWHFLTHLDPLFCDQEDILKEADDILKTMLF